MRIAAPQREGEEPPRCTTAGVTGVSRSVNSIGRPRPPGPRPPDLGTASEDACGPFIRSTALPHCRRRHSLVGEFLQPHAGRRDVDVALRIGGDEMAADNAGGLDLADKFERLAVDDGDRGAVADIEEL